MLIIENNAEGLADVFCDLDHDQQVQFFNAVALITSNWDENRGKQWAAVGACDAPALTEDARHLLQELAHHCQPGDPA